LGAILPGGGARRKPADRAGGCVALCVQSRRCRAGRIARPSRRGLAGFRIFHSMEKSFPWHGKTGEQFSMAWKIRIFRVRPPPVYPVIHIYTYVHNRILRFRRGGGWPAGETQRGGIHGRLSLGAHLRLGAHVQVILSAGAQRRSRNHLSRHRGIWASSQRLACGTKPRSLDSARDDSRTAGFPIWMHRIADALPGSGGQNGLPVGRGFATRIG